MGLLEAALAARPAGGAVQFEEEVALGDADVAAYAVRVAAAGPGLVAVAVAARAPRPLRLHWGTAERPGGGWRPAPEGWTTQPPRSVDGGKGAWVTDFGEMADGSQLVEVKLRAKRGAFAFVLRTHSDRFIKRDGRDMYVPVLRPKAAGAPAWPPVAKVPTPISAAVQTWPLADDVPPPAAAHRSTASTHSAMPPATPARLPGTNVSSPVAAAASVNPPTAVSEVPEQAATPQAAAEGPEVRPRASLPPLPWLASELRVRMHNASVLFGEEVLLEDPAVSGYVVRVGDTGTAIRVAIAVATSEPLRLHWGLAKRPGAAWFEPPVGWSSRPPRSYGDVGGAQVTDFEGEASVAGVQIVEVLLPPCGGVLAFVLRTFGDRFIKRGGCDMYAPISFDPLPEAPTHEGSRGERERKRVHGMVKSETATRAESAEGEAEKEVGEQEEPLARKPRNLDELRCDSGALRGGGGFADALAEEVAHGEADCQRSLMHRFNFAAKLLARAAREGQDGLVVLFVWLRFVAMRQLVINRNYNVKPREISSAQEQVTLQLADLATTRPDLRDIARMTMASIGRGGAGDVGQRIRDEILEVQKRNDCKGGMMEEWHQKLHNNTCPDDVSICEALLAYIDAGLDIKAYWARLAEDRVTRERLASYDRKICSEPHFRPDQCSGLTRDLREYLKTLKAVHSGADLESAAGAVLGYSCSSRKGVSVRIEPVANVASPHLRRLIAAALRGAEKVRQGSDPTPALEAMLEARWELRPWTRPCSEAGSSIGQRMKDVLYLDLALETALRTTIEGSLARLSSGSPTQVTTIAGLALENLTMSAGGNSELLLCLKEWREASALMGSGGSEPALRTKAAMDRVRNELAMQSDRCVDALQAPALALGGRLGVSGGALSCFSEEVVRGGAAAPLAQLLRMLDPILRKVANLGAWQIISPVEVSGRLRCVPDLVSLQHAKFSEPTVLVVHRVGGEEDIPDGAVAVLTPDMPDILSHIAVRARNERKLFATILDTAILEDMRSLEGVMVACRPSAVGDTVLVERQTGQSLVGETASAGQTPVAAQATAQIQPRGFCEHFALVSADFSREVAGGKSCNLQCLRGRLPEWIKLPASVVIPFGSFEAVLADPMNAEVSRKLSILTNQLQQPEPEAAAESLTAIRKAVREVQAPPHLTATLHAAFDAERLPWPGDPEDGARGTSAWAAITGVWASKWNDAAFTSCRKAGLKHPDLSMAVLCQQVVDARYSFVVHTTNPTTGDAHELYAELVCGLGEALVGNFSGRALSFVARKDAPDCIEVKGFPSKSVGLFIDSPTIIFRSDSNGEDLEGYAGAGLYDSVIMDSSSPRPIDYSSEPLLSDSGFRERLLRQVVQASLAVERTMGCAQDIEGAIDAQGCLTIVQTRPQV